MAGFHPMRAFDESFFASASFRVELVQEIRTTPEKLFETLEGDEVWTRWAPGLKQVTWTSPPPLGQGATRNVQLAGGFTVREVFFIWKPAERVAFYVEESDIPGLLAFGEDYKVEDLGERGVRLTWTVAAESSGFMRLLSPLLTPITATVLRGWLRNLQGLLEAS